VMARKVRHPRCKWCGKRLDSRAHRNITEGYCYVRNEKAIRSRLRPRVKTIGEVYDEKGWMRPEFIGTDMEAKLMARQQQLAVDALLGLSEDGYKIPTNVEVFNNQGYVLSQVSNKRPWAVVVLVEGRRKRRLCNNLYEAVEYHRRIQKKYPASGIVSRARAYELPARWRLKLHKLPKKFKWCPYCGAFRVYHRVYPEQRFFAQVKKWSETKKRYDWIDRQLWLTECQLCGNTNRDSLFRRNNQPWEVRHIKQGVKKVKPRVRTERGRQAAANKRRRRR
jgi:hypothetical protein